MGFRLEWQAPVFAKADDIRLIGEGFNVFNFDSYGSFENFKLRLWTRGSASPTVSSTSAGSRAECTWGSELIEKDRHHVCSCRFCS